MKVTDIGNEIGVYTSTFTDVWAQIKQGGGYWQGDPVNNAVSTVIDRVTLLIVHLELLFTGWPCQ